MAQVEHTIMYSKKRHKIFCYKKMRNSFSSDEQFMCFAKTVTKIKATWA